MFRIRLADGEEAVYRTTEELALGLSSGIVTPAAEYFQPASQAWRPIASHPEFDQAMARAASLIATAEPSPNAVGPAAIVPTSQARDGEPGPLQIYQMFSQSAAELQARRRPRWLLPVVSASAALIMVVSVALTLPRSHPASAPVPVPAGPPAEKPAKPTAEQPSLPTPLRPRTGANPSEGPEDMQAVRLAPVNLAAHRSRSIEAANLDIADSARRLGLHRVLRMSRLQSADSLALTRQMLAAFRSLIASHRANVRRTDAAYRDSAAGLFKAGVWSRVDEQEWRVRVAPVNVDRDGLRTDSLVATMESLFGFLAEHAGHFEVSPGAIRFTEPAAGAEYDRLRATLLRQAEKTSGAWDRPSPLLLLLVDSLDTRALPPRGRP